MKQEQHTNEATFSVKSSLMVGHLKHSISIAQTNTLCILVDHATEHLYFNTEKQLYYILPDTVVMSLLIRIPIIFCYH